jgi:hypothetical protein
VSFPINEMGKLQRHIAITSIGPTSLRKMRGTAGKRADLYALLGTTNLALFSIDGFEEHLDQLTKKIEDLFGGNFGAARKSANLFLRDCVNHYALRAHYGLASIEHLLEVPLDSISMRAIREEGPEKPSKVSVSDLDANLSSTYQRSAAFISADRGIDRVHLDTLWWADGRR